ncbi:MAG TPA: rRNA maturation RNase YbeY [Candidatus Acidoferrales bacterium]|nr:rRNA maturation RNase YbeY [Candidatus Acidoferrales bacterium]
MAEAWGVQYAVPRRGVPAAASFRRWIAAALAGVARSGAGTVRIVDEAESAALNEAYRGKRGPTNVLSFAFEAPPGLTDDYLGDLVVCAPVVMREAQAQGKSARAHFAHLAVHGILHLAGYDHLDEADAREMEAREVAILAILGFEDPYGDLEDEALDPPLLLTTRNAHVRQR